MAQPPIKTTAQDIDVLVSYLKNQVGWIEVDKVKKAIPPANADNRKLEAMRYLRLLDRDAGNIKLTEAGRRFADAKSEDEKADVVAQAIRSVPLYYSTLEWLHYGKKLTPTKTDIANYWHDHQAGEIGDAKGAALTDAAVFFLRMVGLAGLGQFVAAGAGRDTHAKINEEALSRFIEGVPSTGQTVVEAGEPAQATENPSPREQVVPARVSVGSGLNVHVEIHIAANAEVATIEEIFRNLRKYLIDEPIPDE